MSLSVLSDLFFVWNPPCPKNVSAWEFHHQNYFMGIFHWQNVDFYFFSLCKSNFFRIFLPGFFKTTNSGSWKNPTLWILLFLSSLQGLLLKISIIWKLQVINSVGHVSLSQVMHRSHLARNVRQFGVHENNNYSLGIVKCCECLLIEEPFHRNQEIHGSPPTFLSAELSWHIRS